MVGETAEELYERAPELYRTVRNHVLNDPGVLYKVGVSSRVVKNIRETRKMPPHVLVEAISNHMVDDNPGHFGLTLDEAYTLRSWVARADIQSKAYEGHDIGKLILIGISSLLLGYIALTSNSLIGRATTLVTYNLPIILGFVFIISLFLFAILKRKK